MQGSGVDQKWPSGCRSGEGARWRLNGGGTICSASTPVRASLAPPHAKAEEASRQEFKKTFPTRSP
jgi:hypothetical protein